MSRGPLQEPEAMTLDPQHSHQMQVWQHTSITSALVLQRQDPISSMASQASQNSKSRFSETLSQKANWKATEEDTRCDPLTAHVYLWTSIYTHTHMHTLSQNN